MDRWMLREARRSFSQGVVHQTKEDNQALTAAVTQVVLGAGDPTLSRGFRACCWLFSTLCHKSSAWLWNSHSRLLGFPLDLFGPGSGQAQFSLSHDAGWRGAGLGQSPRPGATPPGSKEKGEWGLKSGVCGDCVPAASQHCPAPACGPQPVWPGSWAPGGAGEKRGPEASGSQKGDCPVWCCSVAVGVR